MLVSVAGCAVINGDHVVQELAWAFLQAQQAISNILDPVAHERPILDHGEVLLHQQCLGRAD